ncbi:AVB_G0031600.mRNA.1.CDS.1 [Saccharomyces cerevisiae]|nr:AVB_G0031600.mRNA.1.CDS.1 [Saccharomyces cerevisiae]CAI7193476.1 AVB_G0031600.mRNA.1.CDS.1 [Saccharomyces cerevisiae]
MSVNSYFCQTAMIEFLTWAKGYGLQVCHPMTVVSGRGFPTVSSLQTAQISQTVWPDVADHLHNNTAFLSVCIRLLVSTPVLGTLGLWGVRKKMPNSCK